MALGIFGIFFLAFFVLAYFIYAGLNKTHKETIFRLTKIEALLRERHTVIAPMAKLAKKIIIKQDLLFEEIEKLRKHSEKAIDQSNPIEVAEFLQTEALLQNKMEDVIVFSEKNKELKNDNRWYKGQNLYFEFEQPLKEEREKYNAEVKDLNKKVRLFPSNLVANMMDIKAMPLFNIID